jgi:hypothetical protein
MWMEAVESGEGLVNRFLVPRFNVSFRDQFFGRKHNILWVFSTPNRFLA